MPRINLPPTINGQGPAWWDEQIHNEYRTIATQVRHHLSGVSQWNTNQWTNNWTSVRWRAVRLLALRQRVINTNRTWLIERLPMPSLLEQLPEVLLTEGTVTPRGPRAPHTSTAIVALSTALDADLTDYTFGVEIECYMPRNMGQRSLMADMISEGFQAVIGYYRDPVRPNVWKITQDGSLGDRRNGIEVVSPVLQGSEGIQQMRKMMKFLEEKGCTVRRQAGFHVHIGAEGRDVNFFRNLIKLYGHYEGAIDSITSQTRRANNNSYCRSTKARVEDGARSLLIAAATNIDELALAYAGSLLNIMPSYPAQMENRLERFLKVNLAAFWRHTTVEFRQHQGTVDADKAEHWVRVCLRIYDAAVKGLQPEGDDSLQNFANTVNIPANELAFLQARVAQLNRVITERR
jgi:hypothetical protein